MTMEYLHSAISSISFILLLLQICPIDAHGRLIEPPGRSTMWRYGFQTPANFNDNQLFCGGKSRQWNKNGGKCGICGDPYDGTRENEAGGKYATGTISQCYETSDSSLTVKVEITANHKGYFEFRLCPHDDPSTSVSRQCLDDHLLILQGTGETRYYIGDENKVYDITLNIPDNVTCTQCLLQWKYNTGNSWGCDFDDPAHCDIGLGPQEQFYGCADIAILDRCDSVSTTVPVPMTPTLHHATSVQNTSVIPSTSTVSPAAFSPAVPVKTTSFSQRRVCHATGAFSGHERITEWCKINCAMGNCPSTHCKCTSTQTTSSIVAASSTFIYSNNSISKEISNAPTPTTPSEQISVGTSASTFISHKKLTSVLRKHISTPTLISQTPSNFSKTTVSTFFQTSQSTSNLPITPTSTIILKPSTTTKQQTIQNTIPISNTTTEGPPYSAEIANRSTTWMTTTIPLANTTTKKLIVQATNPPKLHTPNILPDTNTSTNSITKYSITNSNITYSTISPLTQRITTTQSTEQTKPNQNQTLSTQEKSPSIALIENLPMTQTKIPPPSSTSTTPQTIKVTTILSKSNTSTSTRKHPEIIQTATMQNVDKRTDLNITPKQTTTILPKIQKTNSSLKVSNLLLTSNTSTTKMTTNLPTTWTTTSQINRTTTNLKIKHTGTTNLPSTSKISASKATTNLLTTPTTKKLPIKLTTYKTIDCEASETYRHIETMKEWCQINCLAGLCPPTHCVCVTEHD